MSAVAAASVALTRASWLADDTDVGDETHKAGPIAIIVIIALCVACFLLFRSMSKHMRKVREEFPVDAPPPAATDTAGEGSAPTVAAGPAGPRSDPPSRADGSDDPASS